MRKTKYTPETLKAIEDRLLLGMSREDAWILAGISEPTFYAWMTGDIPKEVTKGLKGDALEAKKREFSELVVRAERSCKERHLAYLEEAAQKLKHKDPKTSTWFLSHRYPQEFSEKRTIVHEGQVTQKHEFDDQQLDHFLGILEGTAGAGKRPAATEPRRSEADDTEPVRE